MTFSKVFMEAYLGVDVGSVTTKLAVVSENGELVDAVYLRTQGKPVAMIQEGLSLIEKRLPVGIVIRGVGTTGSARYLAGVILGADLVKNEVTSHAIGTMHYVPDVQTIIEIGGQDSKMIIVRKGVVVDFGMNTVCAAGTGSFLDHQALRLGIAIEEFGKRALESRAPVRLAGRCTVFAESDMIHKQQLGHRQEDIIYGLCQALVRNYLNNVGLGKEVLSPVVFQGGVAFNRGIVRALEESLNTKIVVPSHHEVMGAMGVALLVMEERSLRHSQFKGFGVSQMKFGTSSFECKSCTNLCEIAQISQNGKVLANWGGKCDLWEGATVN